VAGNLTLNGVTKPVSIAAHFVGAGKNIMSGKETVGFEGTPRSADFGVNGVLPFVSDEVKLNITIAFEKTADLLTCANPAPAAGAGFAQNWTKRPQPTIGFPHDRRAEPYLRLTPLGVS
jgi:hypothetical protein